MDGPSRRTRLRTFALGGAVGAAGAIATVARLRTRKPRNAAAGLAAFEDAPCYLEVVGREAKRHREAGEAGRSSPE